MPTEKPAGAYQMLSKSRAMYRGNPLLTLDHLQFFKPVEVPVDVLIQNRCIKETIVVNPLTGIIEVSGIALFSSDRLRNEKYKEDHRVWILSDTAKKYLKQVTGNDFDRVVSYHDTKRVVNYLDNGDIDPDVVFTTPLKYNTVFDAKSLHVLTPDYIPEYTNSNTGNNDTYLPTTKLNPFVSLLSINKARFTSYNRILRGDTGVADAPYMISRDIVVMTEMLDMFNAIGATSIYQSNMTDTTSVTLRYTPIYIFNNSNLYKQAEEILRNNTSMYTYSNSPHGQWTGDNYNLISELVNPSADKTTSFLQYVPYKYQFTLKNTDIVSFYLDLIAGKLWNRPNGDDVIDIQDEKYNRITLTHLNKEYKLSDEISNTINCVYTKEDSKRTRYGNSINYTDSFLQFDSYTNAGNVCKSWAFDDVYKKSIPIKSIKLDGNAITLSDIKNGRFSQNDFSRNKNIIAILPDDTEVPLYKYLIDNDMIPEKESDGAFVTLALKDEGDLPTLISYQFTAYPRWWQLVWNKNYYTPAFSSYEQFNYFYKDAEWLTDAEKELYRLNGKDVFAKPRKLGPNELLVVLPKSGAKFLGQNVEHNGLLPGDTRNLFYRHNFMAVASEMNDYDFDSLTFGTRRLSYEEAVIELIYGNWYKPARFDEQNDSPSTITDLRNHVRNVDELLSTITFNNIDMPWWGTISVWFPTDDGRTTAPRYVRSFIDNAREMGLSPTEFWMLISLAFIQGYRTRWVEVKPSLFTDQDLIPTLKRLGNNDGQYFKTYMSDVITNNVADAATRNNLINVLNRGQVDTSHTWTTFSYNDDKYLFNFGIDTDESAGTYIPQQRVLNYYWIQSHSNHQLGGSVFPLKGISGPLTTYNFNPRSNVVANHNIKNDISVGDPSIYAYNPSEATNKALTGYEVGHHSMFGTFGHRYLNLHSGNNNKYTDIVSYLRKMMVDSGKYLTMDILNYSWMNNIVGIKLDNQNQFKLIPGYSAYWGYLDDTAKNLAVQLGLFDESGVNFNTLRNSVNVNTTTGVDDAFKVDDTNVYLTVPVTLKDDNSQLNTTGGYGDNKYNAPILKRGLHLNGGNSIVNLYLAAFYASRLRVRVGLARPDLPIWDERDNEIHKADMKILGYDLDKYAEWIKDENSMFNITVSDKGSKHYIELILTPDKHGIYNFLKRNGGGENGDAAASMFGDELRGSVNILTNDESRFGAHLDQYRHTIRGLNEDYDKYLTYDAKDNLNSYLSKSGFDLRYWGENPVNDAYKLKSVYFKGMEDYNNILYRHMYGMQALPVLWGCVNDSEEPSKSVYNQYLADINKINTDYQYGNKVYPLMYNQLSSTYHLNTLSNNYRTSLLYNNPDSPFIRRVYNNYIYSTYKGGYGLTLAPYIWSTYSVNGKGYDYRLRYQHVTSLGVKDLDLTCGDADGDFSGIKTSNDLVSVIDRMDVNHRIHNSLDVAASAFSSSGLEEKDNGLDISDVKYQGDRRSALFTNTVFTPSILGGFLSAWTVQTIMHYGVGYGTYNNLDLFILNNLSYLGGGPDGWRLLSFNTAPDINNGRFVNFSYYTSHWDPPTNPSTTNITNNINYDNEDTLSKRISEVYKRIDDGNEYEVRVDSATDLIGTVIYHTVKDMFGLPRGSEDETNQWKNNTLTNVEDYQLPLVIEIDALYESTKDNNSYSGPNVPNVEINQKFVPDIPVSSIYTQGYGIQLAREISKDMYWGGYTRYKNANWVNVHREYIDLNKYVEFADN